MQPRERSIVGSTRRVGGNRARTAGLRALGLHAVLCPYHRSSPKWSRVCFGERIQRVSKRLAIEPAGTRPPARRGHTPESYRRTPEGLDQGRDFDQPRQPRDQDFGRTGANTYRRFSDEGVGERLPQRLRRDHAADRTSREIRRAKRAADGRPAEGRRNSAESRGNGQYRPRRRRMAAHGGRFSSGAGRIPYNRENRAPAISHP